MKTKKLIASGERPPATRRLNAPCSDCPLLRTSLNGWLGGSTPEDYGHLCHSDAQVECHVHAGSRCAGLAIYRTNVAKRQPVEDALPADRKLVFANRAEFLAHHNSLPFASKPKAKKKSERCVNCDAEVNSKNIRPLAEVPDLLQRVEPGEPMPDGECRACGALVHLNQN